MDSIEKLNSAITLIEEARGVPLSASCVVHRGEILEILDGARVALPTDLDQAIEIISARERIIEEARTSAEHLIATAREDVSRMVEQTAIVQAARDEAQRILDDARALADEERAEVETRTERRRTVKAHGIAKSLCLQDALYLRAKWILRALPRQCELQAGLVGTAFGI
jgi:vacuolar-type H+-ATPase subunit H